MKEVRKVMIRWDLAVGKSVDWEVVVVDWASWDEKGREYSGGIESGGSGT